MSNPVIHEGSANGDGAWDALTDAGRSRRDAMLSELQDAVVREGRRRRARKSAGRVAGTMLLLALFCFTLVRTRPGPTNLPIARIDQPTRAETPRDQFVSFLETVPGALDRHRIDTKVELGDYIVDNRELVSTLAAIGRPAGLIRTQGGIRLTAAVTDAEMAREESDRTSLDAPLMPAGKDEWPVGSGCAACGGAVRQVSLPVDLLPVAALDATDRPPVSSLNPVVLLRHILERAYITTMKPRIQGIARAKAKPSSIMMSGSTLLSTGSATSSNSESYESWALASRSSSMAVALA